MKKGLLIITVILVFASLFTYTLHIKLVKSRYESYLNTEIGNQIRPLPTYLNQINKSINEAAPNKTLTNNQKMSIYNAARNFALSIQTLSMIENTSGYRSQNVGNITQDTFTSLGDLIHDMTDGKNLHLNKDQLKTLQKILLMDNKLLNVLKPVSNDTEFNIEKPKWINIMKQMDGVISTK